MDPWIVIFLCTAANGLFLSIGLYLQKSKQANILGCLILSFTLLLSYYIVFWAGYTQDIPRPFGIVMGLTYVLGPFLLWYVKKDLKRPLLHFLPFGAYVIFFLAAPYVSLFFRQLQVVAQNLHLILYALLIMKVVVAQGAKGQTPAFKLKRGMALAFLLYATSFLGYYILVWTGRLRIEHDYFISLASALLIYWVGFQGWRYPERVRQVSQPKYQRSSLGQSASKSIVDRLKKYFEEENPFLSSELGLEQVSERLAIPRHHISQAINQQEGIGFPEFINHYRLLAARKLLEDPLERKTKIIDIAYRSGFNNKVSFYQTFRKHLGTSPATYRQRHQLALSN